MNKSAGRYYLATATMASAAALLSGAAYAQTPSSATTLDEIVVTAEHRTQNLQKVPLAISVREGAELAAEGRTSVKTYLEDVPSISWKPNTGTVAKHDTDATSISIRGIGSNGAVLGNTLSLVPAVAQYVDGVVGGIGGNFDVDRVEVLRGPQGTLYGRSATAGVVDIHTKDPVTGAFAGDVSAEVGSFDLRRVSAGVNAPVSSVLAVRGSAQYTTLDGYYNGEAGLTQTTEGRVKALFKPNDQFSAVVGVAEQKRKFNSGGKQVTLTPSGVDFNTVAPIGKSKDDQVQYWANFNYDFGFANLTYIPAYRSYTKDETSFNTFGGVAIVTGRNKISTDTFNTQEIRLASSQDKRLRWQTGLYYYNNNITADTDQSAKGGPFPGAGFQLHLGRTDKETTNIGVFGEVTFDVTDTTRLTAGLRHDTTEIKTVQNDCSGPVGLPGTCVFLDDKRDWSQVSYKLRAEHDLTEDSLIYASVSTAFLPGDVAVVTGAGGGLVVSPYEQEILTSYELGSKARLFDNRVQINSAIFFYDYGGYQQAVQVGSFGTVTLSAIRLSPAQVKGAEAEVVYRPTGADRIEVNASFLDAKYVNKPAIFASGIAQTDIPGIIPVQVTGSYAHTFDLGGDNSLTLKGEAAYSSAYDVGTLTPAQMADPVIRALLRQKAVTIGNLYATWKTSHGISVSAYARNVADTSYTYRVDANGASTSLGSELAAPRTFGLVVNASF